MKNLEKIYQKTIKKSKQLVFWSEISINISKLRRQTIYQYTFTWIKIYKLWVTDVYCKSIIGKHRVKRVNKYDNLFFHFSILSIKVNKKTINSTMTPSWSPFFNFLFRCLVYDSFLWYKIKKPRVVISQWFANIIMTVGTYIITVNNNGSPEDTRFLPHFLFSSQHDFATGKITKVRILNPIVNLQTSKTQSGLCII